MRAIIYTFLVILTSCNYPVQEESSIPKTDTIIRQDDNTATSNQSENFSTYLTGFRSVKPTYEIIEPHFIAQFIEPSFRDESNDAFYPNFTYQYGKFLYENDHFIALTYYMDGDTGYDMLDREYLITYDKLTGKYINSEYIAEVSEIEQSYLGEKNMTYSINILNNGEIAFEVDCELIITEYDRDKENPFADGGTSEEFNIKLIIMNEGQITSL